LSSTPMRFRPWARFPSTWRTRPSIQRHDQELGTIFHFSDSDSLGFAGSDRNRNG
jgi:hypothetical protein